MLTCITLYVDMCCSLAAPGAGIFDGVHSIPGDLMDHLTRNGAFTSREPPRDRSTVGSAELPHPTPANSTANENFVDSLEAILALAERYPAQSLPLFVLRAFAHFLPALIMPCLRRCKPTHTSINMRHCQKGKWETFWTLVLLHNNRKVL